MGGDKDENNSDLESYVEQLEARVKDLEARRESLLTSLDTARVGVVLIQNRDGVEFAQFRVTDYYAQLTGRTKEELRGTSFLDFLSEDDVDYAREHLRKLRTGQEVPLSYVANIVDQEGKSIPVEVIVGERVFKYHGEDSISIVVKDLANARLAQIAAETAHSINNVLTSILGRVEFGLERDDLPADIMEDLEVMKSSGERIALLTERLMAISEFKPEPKEYLDFYEVVKGVYSEVYNSYQGQGINLSISPKKDIPKLRGSPIELKEIVLNLLNNARDAVESAEEKKIEVDVMYENGYIVLGITDTGSGVSEEEQGNIFKSRYTTKGKKGHGLGLATVDRLVKYHKGNVKIQSEVGEGATFRVYLPLRSTTQKIYIQRK